MSERRGTKGLELWCKKMTEGYPGVKVENMTTSWRNGLAFCAIIHHFRPDLIDFSKLNKDDIYHNNELAFRVAEHHLGIPALLEPEDMVEYSVPDRLSILTYLSQFYQAFAEPRGSSSSRMANKRPQTSPEHDIGSPTSSSPPTKVASVGIGKLRREPCAKCGLPVFIAERLNIGKLHFHRTCFKCARCNSQLTLASYYETEKGEFCCEVCPDEEKTTFKASNEKLLLQRSMSDEEKSASLRMITNQPDDYSFMFETALENVDTKSDEFLQARSNFFSSQIASSDSGNEEEPPDLPNTEPPGLAKSELNFDKVNCSFPDVITVHSIKSSVEKPLNSSRDIVTKEQIVENTNDSLVKARMRFFENDSKSEISRSSQISNQVPVIPIVKLDELENFNVSKKDINYTDDNKINSSVREESNVSINVQNSNIETNLTKIKLQDSMNNKNKDILEDNDKESEQYCQKSNEEFPKKTLEVNNDSEVTSIRDITTTDGKVPEISESPEKVSKRIDMLQKCMTNSTEKDVVTHENSSSLPSNRTDHLDIQNLKILNNSKWDGEMPVDDSNREISATDSLREEDEHSVKSSSPDESVKILTDSSITEDDKSAKNTDDSVQILSDSYKTQDSCEAIQILTDSSKTEDQNQAQTSLPVIEESITEDNKTSGSDSVVLLESQSDVQHDLLSLNDTTSEASPDAKINSQNKELDEDYPEDLNPFGDEEEKPVAKKSLNPFGSDEEEDDHVSPSQFTPQKPAPTPRMKKKIIPNPADRVLSTPLRVERISLNPFEDDEGDTEAAPPVPATRKKKVIAAPKISLNPFWSDDEENNKDSFGNFKQPVPIPRGVSRTSTSTPEPRPRDYSNLTSINRSLYGSTSSISSGSFQGSARKKKPAPRPPIPNFKDDSAPSSLTVSPSHSAMHSPHLTPKYRKNKRAPLPPASSTPIVSQSKEENEMDALKKTFMGETDLEKEKIVKDEQNRSKQNYDNNMLSPTSSENSSSLSTGPNKSTYGQWKRRKAQAPKRPIPQRRLTKCLPMSEIRRELDLIETQQQGLERQGVRLEQIIREKSEGTETTTDEELPIDVEDLILQLFEIVNEKNELFRKQTELMYLKRQQRLEEEHADVEYQIRCLMLKPEDNKTDSDKAREEELIKRLVDIVERRNEVIECLEMDRVREAEEDSYINDHINLYTSKRDGEKAEPEKPLKEKDKKKKHKKEPKSKSKSKNKIDIDKDIDESESRLNTEKKKKKKFNLF